MTDKPQGSERFSLSRWSRRKHAAAAAGVAAAAAGAAAPALDIPALDVSVPDISAPEEVRDRVPNVANDAASTATSTDSRSAAQADVAPTGARESSAAVAVAADPLPAIESLAFDSDFTRFMQPDVEPALKQAALKKLFADPRFNVMDGLDTYIADYSQPDPMPPGMLEQLWQGRHIFDPPATALDAEGNVVDVVARAENAVETEGEALPLAAPVDDDAAREKTAEPADSVPIVPERQSAR